MDVEIWEYKMPKVGSLYSYKKVKLIGWSKEGSNAAMGKTKDEA